MQTHVNVIGFDYRIRRDGTPEKYREKTKNRDEHGIITIAEKECTWARQLYFPDDASYVAHVLTSIGITFEMSADDIKSTCEQHEVDLPCIHFLAASIQQKRALQQHFLLPHLSPLWSGQDSRISIKRGLEAAPPFGWKWLLQSLLQHLDLICDDFGAFHRTVTPSLGRYKSALIE